MRVWFHPPKLAVKLCSSVTMVTLHPATTQLAHRPSFFMRVKWGQKRDGEEERETEKKTEGKEHKEIDKG